jgi:hypothetical protein
VTTRTTLPTVWLTVPLVRVDVTRPVTCAAAPTTLCVADVKPFVTAPVTAATPVVTTPTVPVSVLVAVGTAVATGPATVETADDSVPVGVRTADVGAPVRTGAAILGEPATFGSGPAAGVGSTAAVTPGTMVVAARPALVVTVSTVPVTEAASVLTAWPTVD